MAKTKRTSRRTSGNRGTSVPKVAAKSAPSLSDPDAITATPTPEEYERQLYQLYLDYRSQLVSHEHELDKAIATANIATAGGAILISITLVGEWLIARTPFISSMLILSWALLVASLICTLLALKYNKDGHQAFYIILDKYAHDDLNNGLGIAKAAQAANPINKKISLCQSVQVWLTIGGVIALLIATYRGVTTPISKDNRHGQETTENAGRQEQE